MAVLTLDEAKIHLNITGAASDTELTDTIASAVKLIEGLIGPIESLAAQTCRIRGGGRGLAFPTATPVVSVQSVTPVGGSAIDLTLLFVNEAVGVIEYDDGSLFSERAYDVVYTAGHASVPSDIKQAAKEQVRHLWEPQRGLVRDPRAPDQELDEDGPLVTPRVRELLAPYLRIPIA